MSKKGLKTMLVCIVLLIGLVTLFACNKSGVADKDGQTKVIVKIQDEDGSIYKENVVFSDLFTLSLQKEGYTGRLYRDADFLKPLTKDSKVKNGDTVYVKWTINKYTVTFMDGKDVLETFTNVPHGSAVTAPEVPKKDGKTFVGWDKKFDNVTSDFTINAVYDVDTFTVTFKDGEKVLETQTVEYEAAATAPDTARLSPPEGMHFANWDKDFSKVTENIEVSAVYELNEYTVIFKNGDTTIKTETVKHGFAATAPNVFDSATEKFVGWDKPFDKVTSDLIVNAKFETKKFTLTFINFDGTTVYTAEVEYGASIEEPFDKADKAATYDTKILDYDGWYKADGTRIDELDLPTMPAENFTLTLRLSLMDSAIGEFTVNTPADFTYGENKSAVFTVNGTPYDGVTYKYIWTINKGTGIYKTEETAVPALTLQNLAAGEYLANVKIVASVEKCGSVEKDFSAGETLTVSRADISGITVTGVTMTYGDKTAEIGISGLQEGDVITYKKDGTGEEFKENADLWALNAGEYKYYVKVERNENYNAYIASVAINIEKAAVTIRFTPDKNEVVYGDDLPALTAYVGETKIGTVAKEDYALKLNEISFSGIATYVGECSIEVKNFTNDYYNTTNFNITFNSPDKITVKKAPLNVNIAEIRNLTYGDDLPEIGYEIKGWKNGDDKSEYKLLPETKYAKKSAVGTYSFTYNVSGEKIENYEVMVNKVYFDVVKKDAKITVNDVQNIIYGEEEPVLSATVDEVLDGDTLSYTLKTDYSAKEKPGGYNAFVEIKEGDNSNYNVSVVNKTFTVLKKELTITLGSKRVAAGKEYKVDAASLTIDGLLADDTVTGYVTITKTEAGVYTAKDFDKSNLKFDSECYEVKYDLTVEFVKVDFKIHFEDDAVDYDGQPHGVEITKTDATKNYTITYGESAENCNLEESPKYTNARAYTIYFKVVDNETQADYAGSVTLTINRKAVEIKVDDVTITYGVTPAFSYTVTGLLNGDTLSGEAVYSGAGTDAGVYDISVSGLSASDNYAVNPVPGTLTINQKSVEVVWSAKDKYVYSPDGQEMPAATYDGKSAKVTTNGEFKNAGTYTFTATDESGNYTLTNAVLNVVIEKTTYSGIVHGELSGVYNPAKTLKDYALQSGFRWANESEKPVCTKTEYAAIYNADSTNYFDFALNIGIRLQKAEVALKDDGVVGFDYDGASHEIKAVVTYNGVALDTSLYSLTYDGKTSKTFTDAGTHRTLVTMQADNYDLPKNTYLYVKVKGVKVGTKYYTIEDALAVATSGQTIFVLNDTAFATQEIAGELYNDVKFKTVKTGVTLLLPFNENDTVGHIGAGEDGSANYKATAALTGTAKLYKTLVIPEGIEVIVNGKLIVGAQTGKIDAGQNQNAVSGNYCEISLGGTITLNNATLEVYGYIKGNGEISANNTTVIENLYLSGWLGGSESAARYVGNREIGVGEALGNELKIDNPNMFPFSQYELRAIQSRVIINKGSKLQGYTKIATGEIDIKIAKIKAQINEALLTFISSDASNAASGLFRLVGNNSKIVKSMSGDRVRFDLYGEVNDGYTSISIKVVKATVKMASEKVFFPIDGRTDITLKNGATFTQSYMFKALPGATITVESGGIYNLNGKLVMYDRSFTEKGYPGAARGDAKLIVNGTMNVNGAFGGNVTSENAGTVAVGANATITNIKSIEGNGSLTIDKGILINAKVILHFTESGSVTKSLVFVNADNSTGAAATNKTYNYNNGKWQ